PHGRAGGFRAVADRGSRRLVRVPGSDSWPVRGPLPRGRALGLGAAGPAPEGDPHPARKARAGARGRLAAVCVSRFDNRWYPGGRPMPRLFPFTSDARPTGSTDLTARLRALSSQETSFAIALVPAEEAGRRGAAHAGAGDTRT